MTVSPSMADRWAGLSDRRAIGRWAWRSFRREWRQQALVLALLVAAVAVAVVAATVIYNTTGVREQARFGSANHRYEVVDFDLDELDSVVATAEGRLGPVDVIGRWTAPIPGSVDSVDYVAQDAGGSFAAPMLDLIDGALPDTDDEVALTNGLEELLGSRLGESSTSMDEVAPWWASSRTPAISSAISCSSPRRTSNRPTVSSSSSAAQAGSTRSIASVTSPAMSCPRGI